MYLIIIIIQVIFIALFTAASQRLLYSIPNHSILFSFSFFLLFHGVLICLGVGLDFSEKTVHGSFCKNMFCSL